MKKTLVLTLMLVLAISCSTNEIETIPVDSPIVNPAVSDTITFEKLEVVCVTLTKLQEDI